MEFILSMGTLSIYTILLFINMKYKQEIEDKNRKIEYLSNHVDNIKESIKPLNKKEIDELKKIIECEYENITTLYSDSNISIIEIDAIHDILKNIKYRIIYIYEYDEENIHIDKIIYTTVAELYTTDIKKCLINSEKMGQSLLLENITLTRKLEELK